MHEVKIKRTKLRVKKHQLRITVISGEGKEGFGEVAWGTKGDFLVAIIIYSYIG